jgi:hypothetical protein
MAENEELKLSVTFDDRASAPLEALRKQFREVGGEGGGARMEGVNKALAETGEHFGKLQQQGAAFGESSKKLVEGVLSVKGAFQSLNLNLDSVAGGANAVVKGFSTIAQSVGTAGLAVGSFAVGIIASGVVLERYLKQLDEYAHAQAHLGEIQKRTGVEPATTKALSEAYQRSGVPQEAAERDIGGLAATRFDINLPGFSETKRKLLTGQRGQGLSNMLARIQQLQGARTDREFDEIARQMVQDVKRNVSPIAAEKMATEVFHAPSLVQMEKPFPAEPTDEQKAAAAKRTQDAEEYIHQLARIEQAFGKIKDAVDAMGLPSVNEALKGIADRLNFIADKFESIAKTIGEIKWPEWMGGGKGTEAPAVKHAETAAGAVAGAVARQIPGLGGALSVYDWLKAIPGKPETPEGEQPPAQAVPAAPAPAAQAVPAAPAQPRPAPMPAPPPAPAPEHSRIWDLLRHPFGGGAAAEPQRFYGGAEEERAGRAGMVEPEAAPPVTESPAVPSLGFEHTDWGKFEREGRPSTNIEDRRQAAPDAIQPVGTDQQWVDMIMAASGGFGGAAKLLTSVYRGIGLAGVGGRVNPLTEMGGRVFKQDDTRPIVNQAAQMEAPMAGHEWMSAIDPRTGRMRQELPTPRDRVGADVWPDRRSLYRAMRNSDVNHTVSGEANLTVDVNAPAGTRVGAGTAGDLFKKTTINRQMQMEHAESSARPLDLFGPL